MTETRRPTKRTAIHKVEGFTDEEKAAMREAARERRTAARRGPGTEQDGEADVLAKIAEMGEHDRRMAEQIHALIRSVAPSLVPRTWYGMPAYARDGKVVCHFQSGAKFKTRYATLGFSEEAHLDDGTMWPVAYALTELTPAAEARIAELVRQAVR
jgi:uncharacterized protein YdhG (YjbR/CyaY superfamily)